MVGHGRTYHNAIIETNDLAPSGSIVLHMGHFISKKDIAEVEGIQRKVTTMFSSPEKL